MLLKNLISLACYKIRVAWECFLDAYGEILGMFNYY